MDKSNTPTVRHLGSTAAWATLFDLEPSEDDPELTQEQFEAEIERVWAGYLH